MKVSLSPADIPASFSSGAALNTGDGMWTLRWPSKGAEIVLDGAGLPVLLLPLEVPVPVIHKRRWWNVLVGNPAGYLPDVSALDSISLGIPRREMHSMGPAWSRVWEAVFFTVYVSVSLSIKVMFKIR